MHKRLYTLLKGNYNRLLDIHLQSIEKKCLSAYTSLLIDEEQFFKNKAHTDWLLSRDKSTKFFHRKMKMHQRRNSILSFQNSSGHKVEDYEEVKRIAVNFFQDLFSEQGTFIKAHSARLRQFIVDKISNYHANEL